MNDRSEKYERFFSFYGSFALSERERLAELLPTHDDKE